MRNRSFVILILALLFGAFIFGSISYIVLFASGRHKNIFIGRGDIGLVTVQGGIFESREKVEELDQYRKDDSIKAVVLRIESPGGGVAASHEIYDAVKRLNSKKPVVVSMGAVAASGGYYIATPATKIIANPSTITGSIGVRMDFVEIGELLSWAKVNHETLKSGKYKDLASPDRPLSSEERKILEDILKEIHSQFKQVVIAHRKIDKKIVDDIADGRIYTGKEAKDLGLVDELGTMHDAIMLAGNLCNIKGEPEVVEKYKEQSGWASHIFTSFSSLIKQISIEGQQKVSSPIFYYKVF